MLKEVGSVEEEVEGAGEEIVTNPCGDGREEGKATAMAKTLGSYGL